MAKHLVCIELNGGMDGINFFGPTDAESVSILTAARQGAPGNVLNYNLPLSKTGDLVAGSSVITNIDTSEISTGRKIYGEGLPARREITVTAIGDGQITISQPAYETVSGANLKINTAYNNLYSADPSGNLTQQPALHYTQSFLATALNTPDTLENANKTKAAIIASIGPLRKKIYQDRVNGGVKIVATNAPVKWGTDTPAFLTSHNDQTSTFQSNAPEGSVKGWGGGIADFFLGNLSTKNEPLATIAVGNLPVFSAGDFAKTFTIDSTGLIRSIPNIRNTYTGVSDPVVSEQLRQMFIDTIGEAGDHLIAQTAVKANELARDFQDVLKDVMNITSISGTMDFLEPNGNQINGTTFANKLRQIARMILANNPNRGATGSRVGNVLTISTEVSNGLATRVAGTNSVRVVSNDHGLFTSNTSSADLSDSVFVLGVGLNSSDPADGYKITIDPADPDNAFFITTATTTELVDLPVTFRLRHNVTERDVVYLEGLESLDSPINPEGYQVTSIVDNFSFTIETTSTAALGSEVFYYKPIDLPAQVIYTNTSYGWDTHPQPNHSQLAAMNAAINWYDSIVSRIKRADTVSFVITEFGRTVSTNSQGTDHGWSNNLFAFGKSVKPGIFGDIMDYRLDGPHRYKTFMMPTTAVYQYAGTLAKWMGLSDGQVLDLFPDLNNWNQADWYLGFL